jgi:hypothetical protein
MIVIPSGNDGIQLSEIETNGFPQNWPLSWPLNAYWNDNIFAIVIPVRSAAWLLQQTGVQDSREGNGWRINLIIHPKEKFRINRGP